MLHAARHQNSYFLLLLFTAWVLSPFVGMIWAYTMARPWSPRRQVALYFLMLVLTVSSLAFYAAVAFGRAQVKVGFAFLAVPFTSWVLLAVSLIGVHLSGLLRRTGGK